MKIKINPYWHSPDIHTYYTSPAFLPGVRPWALDKYKYSYSSYPWSICIVDSIVSRIHFSSILRSGMHLQTSPAADIRIASGIALSWCSRRRRCNGCVGGGGGWYASNSIALFGRPLGRSRRLSSVFGIIPARVRFISNLWGLWMYGGFLFLAFGVGVVSY